jgi:hypothetical protein
MTSMSSGSNHSNLDNEDLGTFKNLKSSSQSMANQRQPTVFMFSVRKSSVIFSEIKHI